MYCKHCGKQIADDSKYCQYCGGQQNEAITPFEAESIKLKEEIARIKTDLETANNKYEYYISVSYRNSLFNKYLEEHHITDLRRINQEVIFRLCEDQQLKDAIELNNSIRQLKELLVEKEQRLKAGKFTRCLLDIKNKL